MVVKKEEKVKSTKQNSKKLEDINNEKKEAKKIEITPQMAQKLFGDERKKLETLNNSIKKVESDIFELDKTIFTINQMKDSKENDIFVNLGNGVYVKAKLDNSNKYNLMTPANVMLEKTSEELLEKFNNRKQNMLKEHDRLKNLYLQTEKNVNQLYTFLNKMQKKQ